MQQFRRVRKRTRSQHSDQQNAQYCLLDIHIIKSHKTLLPVSIPKGRGSKHVVMFLYYLYRALSSNTKHSTNKCIIIIIIYYIYYYILYILLYIIILDIIYNPCKPVQHVSIPFWDHRQEHLWEYKLHKLKPII
jgi:hypothetical protein